MRLAERVALANDTCAFWSEKCGAIFDEWMDTPELSYRKRTELRKMWKVNSDRYDREWANYMRLYDEMVKEIP